MTADLRLVAHAAEGGAREVAPHRARDRAAEGRLADAGRPDEAEDRRLRLGRELAHREELEDAVLHLLEVVVVGVEHLARGARGRGGPRSRCSRGGPRSTRGRCASGGGRARGRAARAGAGARGRPARARRREASPRRGAPASSSTSRCEPSPSPISRSMSRMRRRRMRSRCSGSICSGAVAREVLLRLGDRDLALEVRHEAPEPRHRARLLEQRDALVAGQAHVGGDQVGEQARRREVLEALLPLVGDVVAQVDHPLGELEHPARARPRARRWRSRDVGERLDAHAQRRLLARPRRGARAAARRRSPACPRAARRRRGRRA